MNQVIVTYLKENKDKFPQSDLVAALRTSGFSEEDIAEAVSAVAVSSVPVVTPVANDTLGMTTSDTSLAIAHELVSGEQGQLVKIRNNFFRGVIHGCMGVAVVSMLFIVWDIYKVISMYGYGSMIAFRSTVIDSVFVVIAYVIIVLVFGKSLSLSVKGLGKIRYIFGVVVALLLTPLLLIGSCMVHPLSL